MSLNEIGSRAEEQLGPGEVDWKVSFRHGKMMLEKGMIVMEWLLLQATYICASSLYAPWAQ
jgi:hypothetical protein